MQTFDVVIVGGGMVGAASALSLADLGLSVAVIEAKSPAAFEQNQAVDLRVSAISLASEQLLSQLGVWQQVLSMRACPYKRLGVWEQAKQSVEFNANSINQPHLGHIVENRVIQLALWQRLTQHNQIKLFCPELITAIEQQATGISIQLSSQQLFTKLVVGADGANSFVRKTTAIGITGWDYQQAAMLIYVDTECAQQDITWQQFKPSGPVAMLPLLNNQASLVWYDDIDTINQLARLTNEQLTEQIITHFPERLGKIKVIDKAWFKLTRRHANCYVKQRVLLLGDAAHTINPLAGQGVNLGFKDVKVLQQVIADAISNNQDWSCETVLKRYEQQRRADNLLMMSAMDGFYQVFKHPAQPVAFLRNLALAGVNQFPWVKRKVLSYACGLS